MFAQRQTLSGHIPQAVKKLNLQSVGRLSSTNRLHLAIGLPLRNQEAFNALLQQIYDPASSQYRHYLTTEQFTERFGPTKEDYQALIDYAQANGFIVSGTYPNRVVLDVDATAADIENAFHLNLRLYQHPTEARTFYAPDAEPTPDNASAILHISGLNNFAIPRPRYVIDKSSATANTIISHVGTGSGPSGNFIGNDFRAAYVPGAPMHGAGQVVGLLQFDGYAASDITYYENLAGLPKVTLTNVLIDGATGAPSGNGGEVEVSLDIEMVVSMAPLVSKVILYIAPNPSPWPDLLSRMASDNIAKQISCSWGDNVPGNPDPTSEALFLQMAIQGQSFFNASGDSDAFPDGVPFPSESTNVTQVGGTNLKTTGAGGSFLSETVWNDGGGVGSSGGVSTNFSIPPWQQGINMTANKGSTTMRNVPDVALTASNVYVRADGADQTNVRGTSCAAPLWAGFAALINQQARAGGQPSVGFVNPAVYTIGKGANYSNCFHDTTVGNNGTSTKYPAVNGYDLCTGWGTPNGTNLIDALVGAPVFAPVLVAGGATLLAESCTPTNGAIDPGETVTVSFSLENDGLGDASNVVATLLVTNGVAGPSAPQSYGTILADGGTAAQSFVFTANGTCGSNITAVLQIQADSVDLGTVTYSFSLGALSSTFTQGFDGVTVPALPAGWTTSAGGAESLWVTSTTQRDTLPNAAFSPDPSTVGSNTLVSPVIPILTSSAKLTFRNNYSLEAGSGTVGYDGGVLDIKIGGGAFQDILAAGGSFASGGYTRTISSSYSNPLKGRQAWSGSSSGFITTVANLPAAAAGQNIQLRWMCGTDNSIGKAGWYIDTISISELACCISPTQNPPNAAFSASPTSGTEPLAVTFDDASTGSITNRFWDFGDSGTTNITTNSVVHTYAAGTYPVTLIVSGPDGSSTNTQANYITALTAFQSWQIQYFGNTNNPAAEPTADPDGDGFNNLQEFLAGTDPTNSASYFCITNIMSTGDDVLIEWMTGIGKTNALQATAGTDDGSYSTNDFADIFIVTNTVDIITNYLDIGAATNTPARYYRVRLVP